jgi:hypothetical protein
LSDSPLTESASKFHGFAFCVLTRMTTRGHRRGRSAGTHPQPLRMNPPRTRQQPRRADSPVSYAPPPALEIPSENSDEEGSLPSPRVLFERSVTASTAAVTGLHTNESDDNLLLSDHGGRRQSHLPFIALTILPGQVNTRVTQ